MRFARYRDSSLLHGFCLQIRDEHSLSKLVEKMAEKGMKWYAMRAVSGKEAKLKEYIEAECSHNPQLAQRVSQVLVPMAAHAATRSG